MTSWFQALPAFAVALLVLGIPGTAVLLALRVRGLAALTLAPAISVSIVGVSAIVAPLMHLRWGWPVVLLGTVVTAVAAFLCRRFIPALNTAAEPDKPGIVGAAVVGVLTGLVITATILVFTAYNPEQITQGYDSVFHLNATEYAIQQGNASSFGISKFILPTSPEAFYPAAWHGLSSLLVILTGVSVPAATNVMWLVVAGVLWPLSCVFFTRVLVGGNRTVLLAAGALAAAFPAFPYLLLEYGSAYPNSLSNAMVPFGIGLALLIIRPLHHSLVEPALALALVMLLLPGAILAQPNGIFSILLVLTPVLIGLLFTWLKRGFATSSRHGGVRILILVSSAVVAALLLFQLPQIRSLFNYTNPAFLFFPLALLRNFTHAPAPIWFPAIVLTALVVAGVWSLYKIRSYRWVLASLVLLSFTYPMTAGTNNVVANALLAPWWDNPERIAALMPLLAVPLAAVGLSRFLGIIAARSPRYLPGPSKSGARTTAVAGLAVIIAFSNPGLWQMAGSVGTMYNVPPGPNHLAQLDASELALIHRLHQYTTADDVIANNPYNGSALAMALAGRHMLFPYSSQNDLSPDLYTLRFWLNRVGSDPEVCAAARRQGVSYLLDFGTDYIPAFNNPSSLYPGVTLAPGSRGFTLVAKEGHAALYKLTLCGGIPVR